MTWSISLLYMNSCICCVSCPSTLWQKYRNDSVDGQINIHTWFIMPGISSCPGFPFFCGPVLVLTCLLLVLMAIDWCQHGHPAWSVSMQLYTKQFSDTFPAKPVLIYIAHLLDGTVLTHSIAFTPHLQHRSLVVYRSVTILIFFYCCQSFKSLQYGLLKDALLQRLSIFAFHQWSLWMQGLVVVKKKQINLKSWIFRNPCRISFAEFA